MRELGVLSGLIVLLVGLLVGLLIWSGQDFANRCERAGGVLVKYSVCVTKDSTVLMAS